MKRIEKIFVACFLFSVLTFPFRVFEAEIFGAEPKPEVVKPEVLTGFEPLSEAELQSGWLRLFDGVSLYGWLPVEGKYTVQGGLLVSEQKENCQIRFTSQFGNSIVTGERRPANAEGNWTSFALNLKTDKSDRSKTPDIKLDSGQFRNIKIKPQEMKSLFDGKTLNGWKVKPKDDARIEAKIENGAIRLIGGSGAIESAGRYGDFILQLEYKTDKPINSGVFFRCIPDELMNGYECQIFNNPPDDDYKKFIGTDTGGIFRRQVGRKVGAKDGEWNHLTIFARGTKISTWVNGIQTADWTDERKANPNPRRGCRTEAGTIQFQGHDPATDIMFRNIRIGEL
ncbi:MAG: DUF1080 domain-containing protein [Planctomycetaceae bacterium]|jgi:hypothetical protein|nr:DUF1080 domain-containing protein [Planctomycetaceae bacterium]